VPKDKNGINDPSNIIAKIKQKKQQKRIKKDAKK
jgi:hypothetical protein